MAGIGLASVLGIGLLVTAVLLWPSGSESTVAQGSLTSDLNDESADQEKEAADTFEDRIILVFELPKFDSSE